VYLQKLGIPPETVYRRGVACYSLTTSISQARTHKLSFNTYSRLTLTACKNRHLLRVCTGWAEKK